MLRTHDSGSYSVIFCGTWLFSKSDGGGVVSWRPLNKFNNSLATGNADVNVSSSVRATNTMASSRAILSEGFNERVLCGGDCVFSPSFDAGKER